MKCIEKYIHSCSKMAWVSLTVTKYRKGLLPAGKDYKHIPAGGDAQAFDGQLRFQCKNGEEDCVCVCK